MCNLHLLIYTAPMLITFTHFYCNCIFWEQDKLENLAKFSKGKGYSKNELTESGKPVILYGSMYTDHKVLIRNISTYTNLKENSVISTGNEVIIPSSGESSADISRASAVLTKGIIIAGDINILTPLNNVLPEFLAWSVANKKIKKQLIKMAQGNSVVHLYNSDIKKVRLNFPTKIEQNFINEFLWKIEKLITLYQRKLEIYNLERTAFLNEIFIKNSNENKPNIRFINQSNNWTKYRLEELLTERNEQIVEDDNYNLMSFVKDKGVIPKNSRYDRSFLVKNTSKKYKKTELGDFIYSSNNLETGSIGLNKYGSALISPVYSIFYSKQYKVSEFIDLMAENKNFINKLIRYRQGVIYGQWRINENDFLKIQVQIPQKHELEKIINFINAFEHLIEINLQKSDKILILKKQLLNKLFI